MAPIPLTTASEIDEAVFNIIESGSHYLETDDFAYRRLLKAADSLIDVDPITGYINKAYVTHLTGDYDGATKLVKAMALLNPRNTDIPRTLSQIAFDLGYYSDARKIYEADSSPIDGHSVKYVLYAGICCGAFRATQLRIRDAEKMKLRIQDYINPDAINLFVKILDATKTSDDEVTQLLDCAGEVLRNNKIFQVVPGSDALSIDRAHPLIHMELCIAAPLQKVVKMNSQLADLVAQRVESIPNGFHVSFKWTGYEH